MHATWLNAIVAEVEPKLMDAPGRRNTLLSGERFHQICSFQIHASRSLRRHRRRLLLFERSPLPGVKMDVVA